VSQQETARTAALDDNRELTVPSSLGQRIRSSHSYYSPSGLTELARVSDPAGYRLDSPLVRTAQYTRYFRPSPVNQDQVIALQRWEGTVLELSTGSFVARIRDLTRAGSEEEIEVSFDEVSPSDRELAVPGASFYWTIGYRQRRSGQRLRFSEFWFRRVRGVSRSEVLEAQKRAGELRDVLGW